MTLRQILKRLSPFWLLNVPGWIVASSIIYLMFRATAERPDIVLNYVLLNYPLGLLLTSGLRFLYQRLYLKSNSFAFLAIMATVWSSLGAALWLGVGEGIIRLLNLIPDMPEASLSQFLIRVIFERGFILFIWSALYFGIKFWRDLQEQKMRLMQQSMLTHQAQLQMLRYQLNPHFLFNALNSIRALIAEDASRAERMVTELSEFLRYTLLNKNLQDVKFSDELEAIRSYFVIEKIRFEDRLEIDFEIEPQTQSFQIPGFLIHPLVENAIKYGMQTSPIPLRIKIKSCVKDSQFRIEVVNTGKWLPENESHENGTGMGLKNVRERLRQRYGPDQRLEIWHEDSSVHARVEILPHVED